MSPGVAGNPVISSQRFSRNKGVSDCTSSTMMERPSMTKIKSSRPRLARSRRGRDLRGHNPDLQVPKQLV
jgi:hypothetical protein